MKKIGIIILTILFVGGCTRMEEKETLTDEEIRREMLAYAEERYNREFEDAGDFGHVNGLKSSPFTIQLKTKGSVGREDIFTVRRTRGGNNVVYEDNYSNVHYRELAYKEIQPIVDKYFKENYVLITLSRGTWEDTDLTLSYHQAVTESQADSPDIRIFGRDDLYSEAIRIEKFNALYQELFDKYIGGMLSLYPLIGDDESKISSFASLYEYWDTDYSTIYLLEKDSGGKRKKLYIYWSDGEVITDEQ